MVDPRASYYLSQRLALVENIPLAAQWIRLCGKVVFTVSKEIDGVGKLKILHEGKNREYCGFDGFSLARWLF